MTWRLAVEHTTEHCYSGTVLASYNEARITPRASENQVVMDHEIGIQPVTRMLPYVDYWGTKVTAFDVNEPHERLIVHARSLVETGVRRGFDTVVGWDELASANRRDEFHELLGPSQYVPADVVFEAIAREVTAGHAPADAVDAISEWTRSHMTYERGSTTVRTTASEALALARGVCQDFVHVGIALLRACGIPARYASGYLHPQEEATIDEMVMAESHAWLDAWVGRWRPVDVTNGAPVSERHVLVARGRDYADVPPLKGVYHGPASEGVSVTVAITRVA
jgi:transglutaminase-like putative cysteine protease